MTNTTDIHATATAPFDTLGEIGLAATIADGDGTVWSVWASPAGGFYATTGQGADMNFDTLVEAVAAIVAG